MFDYDIITVSRYDGTRRTTRAIEVFDCVTGRTVGICRQRPYESKQAWIDRAFTDAARREGIDASAVIGTSVAGHQPIGFTISKKD